MFKLRAWDPEFSTEYVRRRDPFSNLVMIDVDVRTLEEIKEIVQKSKKDK